jgi:ribonuclease P protein component
MSYSFPGDKRLRQGSEIKKTLDTGLKAICRNFVVFAAPPPETKIGKSGTRIGIIVSKKNGNSVVRNRIKRLTREAYRHMYESLETKDFFKSLDIVVIARPGAAAATLEDTRRDFLYCLGKLQRQAEAKKISEMKDS